MEIIYEKEPKTGNLLSVIQLQNRTYYTLYPNLWLEWRYGYNFAKLAIETGVSRDALTRSLIVGEELTFRELMWICDGLTRASSDKFTVTYGYLTSRRVLYVYPEKQRWQRILPQFEIDYHKRIAEIQNEPFRRGERRKSPLYKKLLSGYAEYKQQKEGLKIEYALIRALTCLVHELSCRESACYMGGR